MGVILMQCNEIQVQGSCQERANSQSQMNNIPTLPLPVRAAENSAVDQQFYN